MPFGFDITSSLGVISTPTGVPRFSRVDTMQHCFAKSKQQPWTIILLVYVGSIVDLIGLTNTNDKRSRDRYNVELRFKGYYISAGQTSLFTPQNVITNAKCNINAKCNNF